jgi:hypothetical protein
MNFRYITSEEEIQNLKTYKFNAIDDGLTYKYLYNPLSTYAQTLLPPWLA